MSNLITTTSKISAITTIISTTTLKKKENAWVAWYNGYTLVIMGTSKNDCNICKYGGILSCYPLLHKISESIFGMHGKSPNLQQTKNTIHHNVRILHLLPQTHFLYLPLTSFSLVFFSAAFLADP